MSELQPAIDLIKLSEGYRSKPYLCSAGKPTIGWGTTIYPNGTKVTLADPEITPDLAMQYMLYRVKKTDVSLIEMGLPFNTNQKCALISFVYNFSIFKLLGSTLLVKAKVDVNDPTIRDEFMRWVNVTDPETKEKRVNKGLTARRQREADLYFTPDSSC